jgi:hypothetical protein
MIGPYTCYACGKRTKGTRDFMLTVCLEDDDGRRVPVGPDCYRRVRGQGHFGFQPTKGGPRLFIDEAARLERAD